MTPSTILRLAEKDGVSLELTSAGALKVAGGRAAVSRWLPTIRTHKPDLLAVLAANNESDHDTLNEAFEERAAIMEYDGGFTRLEAEQRARSDLATLEPWGCA
jgi:hypothetical protein